MKHITLNTFSIESDLDQEYDISLAPNINVSIMPDYSKDYDGNLIMEFKMVIDYTVTVTDGSSGESEIFDEQFGVVVDMDGDIIRDLGSFRTTQDMQDYVADWADRAMKKFKEEVLNA